MSNSKYKVMADVLEHKNGKGHYVKFKETVEKGTILQLQDPRELLEWFLENGHVAEEKAEERRQAIPAFLTAQLVLRPDKKN